LPEIPAPWSVTASGEATTGACQSKVKEQTPPLKARGELWTISPLCTRTPVSTFATRSVPAVSETSSPQFAPAPPLTSKRKRRVWPEVTVELLLEPVALSTSVTTAVEPPAGVP
jgi:hypothetical protein